MPVRAPKTKMPAKEDHCPACGILWPNHKGVIPTCTVATAARLTLLEIITAPREKKDLVALAERHFHHHPRGPQLEEVEQKMIAKWAGLDRALKGPPPNPPGARS